MPKRTVIQKGKPDGFLFIFCHIGPLVIRKTVTELFPDATVVVELWGEGTDAYTPLLSAYGGNFDNMVAGISQDLGMSFSHKNLTTWSAGSQLAKQVLASDSIPDSMVMLDGLYGSLCPEGVDAAKSHLQGIVGGIKRAAAENNEFKLFGTYSNIPTPYASSKQCWEYAIDLAAKEMGHGLGPDTFCTEVDGRKFTKSYRLNGLQLYEFPGKNAAEHCAQAQMYKVFWQQLLQSSKL